jgi:hypothetical protein
MVHQMFIPKVFFWKSVHVFLNTDCKNKTRATMLLQSSAEKTDMCDGTISPSASKNAFTAEGGHLLHSVFKKWTAYVSNLISKIYVTCCQITLFTQWKKFIHKWKLPFQPDPVLQQTKQLINHINLVNYFL